MIKAIVFDLGGVLFFEGKAVVRDKLAREYGYDAALIDKILRSPKSIDLRKGLIEDDEFWQWVQRRLPEGYDAGLVKREWYEGYTLDRDIFELIGKLKRRYRIVAFSGNIKSRIDFLEGRYRFRSLFDVEVYSFDHHATKPEKKFVEIMLRESNCRPEEIIYVDDNDSYARPARELGINVLIYARGEADKLKREMQKWGVEINAGF
ncbi:MAG: HAD hydrolase-like protein [Deltaproteobacteria bacterium]|nr:HAD hydrolase-like protein [Deltaproteobacteria bacterium]